MPNYAKFLKDIVSKRTRQSEFETDAMTEGCMAMLHNRLPPKLKDPGSFTIPCAIVNHYVGKALCDLGASINLMPKSVFERLGIGKARPTTVMLQLADRSYVHPEGKIEDILVRVDKFIFPADFIVLDCEADEHAPIILGRPFLATGRMLIDCEKGELTIRVNDQKVTLNIFKSLKQPDDPEECQAISAVEHVDLDRILVEASKIDEVELKDDEPQKNCRILTLASTLADHALGSGGINLCIVPMPHALPRRLPAGMIFDFDPEIERTQRQLKRRIRGLMNGNRNNGQQPADGQELPARADGAIAPPAPQMNQQLPARTVRDYLAEDLEGLNPAVMMPDFEAEHFELKPVMFNKLNTEASPLSSCQGRLSKQRITKPTQLQSTSTLRRNLIRPFISIPFLYPLVQSL
ncbi:hypothetical protein GQ457_01G027320 [Hibiscus cannabinus]